MASYADARHEFGTWLVRIEDVDVPRSRPHAADGILEALERYGFEWDGPVWVQSARSGAYEEALARLVAQGVVYECVCTRHTLAAQPIGRIGERVYPGTCRQGIAHHGVAAAQRTREAALRVRVPAAEIAFTDRRQGLQRQRLHQDVGDFVVRRSDGVFAYQLAVVVDDAAQRVTDVVRGADLLASTPRQIFLQRALGLRTPRYLHVPVAVDARGTKLSKQSSAAPLPASALPALHAAWRFLGQRAPPDPAWPVRDFWAWAIACWNVRRIPATARRLAPSAIV
jgi:glutamyl-Q tRNA(Asp) synthetase